MMWHIFTCRHLLHYRRRTRLFHIIHWWWLSTCLREISPASQLSSGTGAVEAPCQNFMLSFTLVMFVMLTLKLGWSLHRTALLIHELISIYCLFGSKASDREEAWRFISQYLRCIMFWSWHSTRSRKNTNSSQISSMTKNFKLYRSPRFP